MSANFGIQWLKKKERKKLIWSYLDLHYNFFPLIISPFIVNHSREFYACNEKKKKKGKEEAHVG